MLVVEACVCGRRHHTSSRGRHCENGRPPASLAPFVVLFYELPDDGCLCCRLGLGGHQILKLFFVFIIPYKLRLYVSYDESFPDIINVGSTPIVWRWARSGPAAGLMTQPRVDKVTTGGPRPLPSCRQRARGSKCHERQSVSV